MKMWIISSLIWIGPTAGADVGIANNIQDLDTLEWQVPEGQERSLICYLREHGSFTVQLANELTYTLRFLGASRQVEVFANGLLWLTCDAASIVPKIPSDADERSPQEPSPQPPTR